MESCVGRWAGKLTGWLVSGVVALNFSALAFAECMSLKSGPLVVDVLGCKAIEPEKVFDPSKEKFKWVNDLDPAGRKAFLDSYRGTFIKVKVVRSKAVQKGLTNEAGALAGETTYMFIPPPATSCAAVLGKRLSGSLSEQCCDGSGDVPCLLTTGYLLQQTTVLGSMESGAGDAVRQRAKKSKEYQAANKSYRDSKWKEAAKLFEKARENGDLDLAGHYKLGHAYREMDQCKDALRALKYVQEQVTNKQLWADEEPVARKGMFLMARCYSKLNDPPAAVMILNSYLLEPGKYRTEIKESLSHKDFGWIHTSKEYRDYKKDAQKKLK